MRSSLIAIVLIFSSCSNLVFYSVVDNDDNCDYGNDDDQNHDDAIAHVVYSPDVVLILNPMQEDVQQYLVVAQFRRGSGRRCNARLWILFSCQIHQGKPPALSSCRES